MSLFRTPLCETLMARDHCQETQKLAALTNIPEFQPSSCNWQDLMLKGSMRKRDRASLRMAVADDFQNGASIHSSVTL